MGYIYLLTSPSGKQYVGQTTRTVAERWKQHVSAAHSNKKSNCRVLNRAIKKHGHLHFIVETLEECEDAELDEKEIAYIQKYKTLVPHGMNLKAGGSGGKWSQETKLKLSDTMNPGLPMYLIKHPRGYRVVNHPMGPEKRFINTKKSDEYNLKRAMDYLAKLDARTEPILVKERQMPKYMRVIRNGYGVRYPGEKPRFFTSKTDIDDAYARALVFLSDLEMRKEKEKKEEKEAQGCSSTTIRQWVASD